MEVKEKVSIQKKSAYLRDETIFGGKEHTIHVITDGEYTESTGLTPHRL